jgi:ribosomal 30S subunit maturation factor RimM
MSAALSATMTEPRIKVGYVRSVNPARRQIRVALLPGCPERLVEMPWILLILEDGSEMRCKVDTVEKHSGVAECTILLGAGVARDNVSRARNASVMVDRKPANEQECAAADWIGFRVVDSAGASLGTVVDMYWTGANNVIEIAKGGGGALLAPAIDPVIARVDAAEKLVVLGD